MKPRHAAALALVGVVFGLASCGPTYSERADAISQRYTDLIREDLAQMKIAALPCQAALGVNPFVVMQDKVAASRIFLTHGCEEFASKLAEEREHEEEAHRQFALLRQEIGY
jgi:hypothetical protein